MTFGGQRMQLELSLRPYPTEGLTDLWARFEGGGVAPPLGLPLSTKGLVRLTLVASISGSAMCSGCCPVCWGLVARQLVEVLARLFLVLGYDSV